MSARTVYHTMTKKHDEMGIMVFGPVAVPVSVLLVMFFLANIPVMILCGLGDEVWGWMGIGWMIYGILWGLVFAGFIIYGIVVLFSWMYLTVRDANDWRKAQ